MKRGENVLRLEALAMDNGSDPVKFREERMISAKSRVSSQAQGTIFSSRFGSDAMFSRPASIYLSV